MLDRDKLKSLYDTLKKGGYKQGYDTFVSGFTNPGNYAKRKQLYDMMKSRGEQIGDTYEDFMKRMQKQGGSSTSASNGPYGNSFGQLQMPDLSKAASWKESPAREWTQRQLGTFDQTKDLERDVKKAAKKAQEPTKEQAREFFQQMEDAADYRQMTGKKLSDFGKDAPGSDFFTPTLKRNADGGVVMGDNGEPLVGFSTDEARKGASNYLGEKAAEREAQEKYEEENAPKPIKGFGEAFKQGTRMMWEGLKNISAETVNLVTGSNQEYLDAIKHLDLASEYNKSDRYNEYKDSFIHSDEWKNFRDNFIDDDSLLSKINPLKYGLRALAAHIENKALREALEHNNYSISAARKELEEKARKNESWGDRVKRDVSEAMERQRPTEGFGAWVGNIAPQMVPSAIAMAASVATKNPAYLKAIAATNLGTMAASTAGLSMSEARKHGASDLQAWGVGLLDGSIEMWTEKIPLDRYTKRLLGFNSNAVKKAATEALTNPNSPAKQELQRLLQQARKKLGGKLFTGKNAKEFAGDILAEGLSEFTAEALETITPMIYQNPEEYPTLSEIFMNGLEGAKAGVFMGSVLGGASKGLQYAQNKQRIKQQGYIDVAQVQNSEDPLDASIVEVLGKDKDGGIVVRDGDEVRTVNNSDIQMSRRFTYDEFRKAKVEYDADSDEALSDAIDDNTAAGYNAADEQAAVDFDAEYNAAKEKAGGTFDDSTLELLDNDPVYALAQMRRDGQYTDDELSAAVEYVNAKAARDGAMQRMEDDLGSAVEAARGEVSQRINGDDFMIHGAQMKADNADGTPKSVHIISGNVSMREDGSVDTAKSSQTIVVRDAATGKVEMVSPEHIRSVDEAIDPQEEYANAEAAARVAYEQKKAGVLEGRMEEPDVPGETDVPGENLQTETPQAEIKGKKEQAEIQQVEDEQGNGQQIKPQTEIENLQTEMQAGAESPIVEQTEIPVEKDKKGNVVRTLYHRVPMQRTLEDLYDGSLDQEEIDRFVENLAADAKRRLASVENENKPQIGSNKRAYLEAKRLYEEKLADARAEVEYYDKLQKEVLRVTQRGGQQAGVAEDLGGEPLSLEELAARFASEHKVTPESLKGETGMSGKELKGFVGLVAREENGGVSIERLGELLARSDEWAQLGGTPEMTQEARNMLIDAYMSGNPRSYVKQQRERFAQREAEHEMNEIENFAQAAFGMSAEDYLAYEEQALPAIINKYAGFDFDIYYAILQEQADVRESEAEANYNNSINGNTYEQQGESNGNGGSGGILQTERTADEQGERTSDEQEAGGQGSVGDAGLQGVGTQGNVGEDTPELVGEKTNNGDVSDNYGRNRKIEEAKAAALERRKADGIQQNDAGEAGGGAGEEAGNGEKKNVGGGQKNVGEHSVGRVSSTESTGGDGAGGSDINEEFVPIERQIIDPRAMSDEERQKRGDLLRNATEIDVTPNQIVSTKNKTARNAAEEWWDNHVGEAKWYETEVGEVEINRNSVESSLAHGYGQMKLDAITSLVDGFSNAVYLGTMPDSTRQNGVLNHYFAYPIKYNDKRCYVFCRALHDNNTNRLYVHEVFVEDKIKKGNTLQTAASQPHGGIALYRDILANVLISDGKVTEKENSVQTSIANAEAETNTDPSEAQKKAGNYKKGHVKIDGFDVTIENPKGSMRRGTDADGKQWEQEMHNTYGYILGTEGVDGDHIDVFLSDNPANGDVFVVDQVNKDGTFDEHKVMYGFASEEEARNAYLSNYEDGWTGLGAITRVSKEEFKKWVDSSHRKTKPFAEYKGVKKAEATDNSEASNSTRSAFDNLKKQASDRMLIFKDGGNYEILYEDAKKAAEILGLPLQEKDGKTFVSFPIKNLDKNLPLLIREGVRVAITDELVNTKNRKVGKAEVPGRTEVPGSDAENTAVSVKGSMLSEEESARLSELRAKDRKSLERRELEEMLTLERKERILRDGTYYDKPFWLKPAGEISSADDIEDNIAKIVKGLKAHEGDGRFKDFEGFSYGGNYAKNAGRQIDEYLQALIDVIPSDITKAWCESNGLETHEDVYSYGESLYKAEKTVDAEQSDIPVSDAGNSDGNATTDNQGNPLNEDGTLKLEKIASVDELTDEDFSKPTRNVELPALPKNVNDAIGANGKPVIIKKNIFVRNSERHTDLSADDSRNILKAALYNPNMYGQSQKAKRPYSWVVINTKDKEGKNRLVLIELSPEKENAEIVHWYYLRDESLETIKRQAEREGGHILILPSESPEEAGGLSSRTPDLSSDGKVTEKNNSAQQGSSETDKAEGLDDGKSKKLSPDTKIDDVGERLEGARKDMRRKIAESLANVTEAELVEKPFGKVYKKPDLKKAVESGALREKDAIFYEALFSMVDQQKPKVTQRDMRSKRYIPDYKTKAERWAADTFKQMEVLRQFMELDEQGRDAMMERMLADRYPTREQELADIEKRKAWNDSEGRKYEWGEMTTPNPLWVTYEVMNRMGYDVGDKLDIPFGVVKANTSGAGYSIENLKGEYAIIFGSSMTLDEAIDGIVYLAKLKRGDADISHPTQLFDFPATKSEMGESGRFRVIYGRDFKTREFDSKEDADAFASTKSGAYVSPIKEVKRWFGYKVRFIHPLTGEKMFVDDSEFDSKEEAKAYFDENFEQINDATNAKLQEEREKKGEKKTLTPDDVVNVTMVKSGEGWSYAVVVDKKYANNNGMAHIIKDGFASSKDARSYADKVKDDVFNAIQKHKKEEKSVVFFDAGEDSRIGEDWRNGKDVEAEDFMNTFGFRGVQFGNWTNQEDRQMAVNQAYDAFMDLASLIGVSPSALSLNGELGIAFGARGMGNASAHYEPNNVVINLTKTRGAGSLAHEWWHALDNYLARSAGKSLGMVTSNRSIEMREELRNAFNAMLDMVGNSEYAKRSAKKGDYWGRIEEVTARLLSEWVDNELKNNGKLNTFLSRGASIERYQKHNYNVYTTLEKLSGREPMSFEEYKETPESLIGIPYPTAKEVEQFGASLRHIFDTLQEKVDEKTGKIALFHKLDGNAKPVTKQEVALRDVLVDVMRDAGMEVITDAEEGQRVLDEANDEVKMHAKKRALETASLSESSERSLTVVSSAAGANILKSLDKAIQNLESSPTQPKTFVGDIANSLGAKRHNSKSEYATFETKNGRVVTIRLADHNATVSNFDRHGELDGISIVVSPKKSAGVVNDGNAHVMEYYYDAIKLRRAEGKPLADIVRSIKQALYSGEFKDTTGLAEVQEVNAGDMRQQKLSGVRFFRTPDGHAYGFTVGGKIFIDPRIAGADTPIHEYTHLWAEALRNANPKEWENIVRLMKGTGLWEEVKKKYPELTTDSEIADEVLAHYSGKRGAERLRKAQGEALKNGDGIIEKTAAVAAINNVRTALKRFWKGIADFFGIHFNSAEEVADKVLSDMLNGVKPGVTGKTDAALAKEEADIIAKAKADGTYLKAPNGKPTNLKPRQWVQVRTKAFKKWFGDWEKRARIEKLRKSESASIAGNEIEITDDYKQNKKNALEYGKRLQGEYTNADTGMSVQLQRGRHNGGIKEVLQHNYKDAAHILSVAAIPQIIEKSVYIESEANNDTAKNPDVVEYQHFVCGLKIGNEDYTVHSLVAVDKHGNRYYDHNLTHIEKTKLLDSIERQAVKGQGFDTTSSTELTTLNGYKGKKLLELLQTDCSKVVDENGEPKVVLHGTPNTFTAFDKRKIGSSNDPGWLGSGFYFYGNNEDYARSYSRGGNLMEVFLNIRDPYYASYSEMERLAEENSREASNEFREMVEDEGCDGVYYNADLNEEWVAFEPTQIKSATDNVGTFDGSNPDIRYQFVGENGAESAAETEAEELARDGRGAYTDDKVSMENDPWSKMAGYNIRSKKERMAFAERERRRMVDKITDMAERLGIAGDVEIVTDLSGLQGRQRRAKGIYRKSSGKITIYIPNHINVADAVATFLHEAVAHKGLRNLFGKHFDEFLDKVYANSESEIRSAIDALAKKKKLSTRTATEEYLAGLAEKTDFVHLPYNGWLQKVKTFFIEMLSKIGIKALDTTTLTDNELRYILWRSYRYMQGKDKGIIAFVEDTAMKMKLGVGYSEKEGASGAAEVTGKTEVSAKNKKNSARSIFDNLKKQQAFDKMFLFKVGDNYEILYEDAKSASEILGLPLQEKDGKEFVSFPVKDLDKNLALLVRGGAYVAVDNNPVQELFRDGETEVPGETDNSGSIDEVNKRFNDALDGLTEENKDLVTLSLGMPSTILIAAGVENKPLKLYGNKVIKKMKKHGFTLDELKDLPRAVADPIAVFDNYQLDGNRTILTELQSKGKNIMVAVTLGKDGVDVDFNIISSVFGKGENNIVDWINKGYARYINKAKALDYLHHSDRNISEALRNPKLVSAAKIVENFENPKEKALDYLRISAPIAEAQDNQELVSAAKIVENFENPKIEGENSEEVGVEADELFREAAEVDKAKAATIYNSRIKSGMYQTYEAMLDSMAGLKEAMMSVLKAEGSSIKYIEDVPDSENAYLGENRLSSVNEAECEVFQRTLFDPLLREVAYIAKTDKERMELTDYMMMKHGLERNAYMRKEAAKKKEETDRDFAGLTTLLGIEDVYEAEAEAQRLVEEYEAGHNTAILWKCVKDVTQATLRKSYECGIISKDTFYKTILMYDYYIPLRGFSDKTSSEEYTYLNHSESSFNAPIRTARGRSSKADDPILQMQLMAESAILQGNRNRFVKQRFLNFAERHPSDLISVRSVWLKYDDALEEWQPVFADINEYDTPEEALRKQEEFDERMEALAESDKEHFKKQSEHPEIPYRVVEKRDLREHQVLVKRGGIDYVLTINGSPRVAQAVNGKTNPDNIGDNAVDRVLEFCGNINRTLSMLYTTASPDFVVGNFARDCIYANTMVWAKEGAKYAAKFNANYAMLSKPGRMKLLFEKYRKGKLDMSNERERLFLMFIKNGGETGFLRMGDVDQYRDKIKKKLRGASAKIPAGEMIASAATWIGEVGRAVETQARFAAFMTSMQTGRSIGRSIWDAKEISVNFNKKGAGDKFIGGSDQNIVGNVSAFTSALGRCLYVFWNAGLQGTFNNFGKTLVRNPKKTTAVMAASFALGLIVSMLGKMAGDDDGDDNGDDEETDTFGYYDISKHTRRQNLVVKIPGTKSWFKLPLPIEFRAMYGMGELAGSTIFGGEPLSAGDMLAQISQLAPIDAMEGWRALIPSLAKPAADAYVNETWYGTPIYKDTPFNKYMPEWTKAPKNTNKYLVDLAATLNEMTGGDKYSKGKIDINPAIWEYLLRQYGGGIFTVASQLTSLYSVANGSKEADWRYVPLLNRFVMSSGDHKATPGLNERYFEIMDKLKSDDSRISAIKKDYAIGQEEQRKLIGEVVNDEMYRTLKAFDREYTARKKHLNYFQNIGDVENAKKAAREIKELKMRAVEYANKKEKEE